MIRIGIVGMGFMGMIHFLAARRVAGARVTAIATRDPRKLAGDWTGIRGNFGPPGEQVDLAGVRCLQTFEEMVVDPEIDLIDICTPTDQHVPMAIAALAAGKHVLVEKPLALDLSDADHAIAAAKKTQRRLMVGHVLPYFPEFRFLHDAAVDRRFGRLLAAQFQRVIAKPDWSAAIADAAQTGGPVVDLHIHDTHFIRLLCGRPVSVHSVGHSEDQVNQHVSSHYHFEREGPAVSCASGVLCQSGRPFMHGYEAYFEDATITYQSGMATPIVYGKNGSVEPALADADGDPVACFTAELQSAVNGIVAGETPPALDAALARDALQLCFAERESVASGNVVKLW